jgi:hypothetical protein
MPSSEFTDYPTFAFLFEHPSGNSPVAFAPYLSLLNLNTPLYAQQALQTLRSALLESRNREREVLALLNDTNWRAQLVGAIALYLDGVDAHPDALPALWAAFDQESYVAPQLVAIARLVDPNFTTAARARITTGCLLRKNEHDARALSALITICQAEPEWQLWLPPLAERADIQTILENFSAHKRRVAPRWLQRFQNLVQKSSPRPQKANPLYEYAR